MASSEFSGMFDPTPAAQPEQQQDALPTPQQGGNEFSGMFDATLAAKARAAGTTTSPKDAGSALNDGVRTGVSPEVIKADPAAFKKNQQDKAAAEAIDSDPDVAHYINAVSDAAAISADDWKNLAHVASQAVKAFQPIWESFADKFITGPAVESYRGGMEDVKQAHRALFPTDSELMDSNVIAQQLRLPGAILSAAAASLRGIFGVTLSPVAPEISAYQDVMEKLGIDRDSSALALLAIGHRPTGRAVASVDPTVIRGKPTGRDLRERTAAYYEEYTPAEIKTWSDTELNKYVNQKMGFGSAATDLAEVQQPKPGVDKGFDQIHVAQAKVNGESLDSLVDAVQTSKTKELSPEAMEAWLNLKGMGTKNVWIDAKAAAEVYGTEAPAAGDDKLGWISGLAERLPEAAELGSEISVPLSKYLANIDPGIHSQFKDLARVDDGLNMQEAKEWIKAWHDDYVKDAEAEDIENMKPDKDPAERLPSNSKPQEYGADNFLPPVAEQGKMPRQAPKIPTSPAAQTYPNERVYNAGLKIVLDSGQASTPFIQRELGKQGVNLTYQQANQLMAVLEKRGIVGPHGEGGQRAVLVGKKKTLADIAPMRQEIKAKPGANTARLAKLLGPKLYGEPTHMDKVTVKELLQNAADAVDAAVEKGQIAKGQIFLAFDKDNRVIKMTDNGTGMAPETLAKEFLEIAGTKKESLNPKGGFGIAKMLINFANKGLHVMTMREGKVSELHTHGEELFAALEDPSIAPQITVRAPTAEDKFFFPQGHGTHIEVTIPENYKDSQTGEMKPINFDIYLQAHPGLMRSPLFGSKVSVIMDSGMGGGMKSLPIGDAFPLDQFTQFPPAKFDWGTAQIYVAKVPKKENFSWEDNIHFLSNGIWQFSDKIKINPLDWASGNIPHDFYIDVHPKVKPEDAGYPFDLNRQGFTRDAKKSIDQILNYLSKTYQQLDFASQVKNYGAISYLRPGKGGVEVSPPQTLEPKVPAQKTSMTGLKETDVIEFKGDNMYVNGKKMPSMTRDDLAKAEIKIDELMVDQKMIKPDQVMMHSSMETRVDLDFMEGDSVELDNIAERMRAIDKRIEIEGENKEGLPIEELDKRLAKLDVEWVELRNRRDEIEARQKGEGGTYAPLDEVAREKFGEAFDNFMYDVGSTFIRLRDGIVDMMGKNYLKLKDEAIGISFDPTYRGVSIRVPFSGSFINPAVPAFTDDPIRAAVGTFGTMVHELAHHKVRSHNADFPAEMQKIQIYLDMAQIMNNTNVNTNYINRQGMLNALAETYKKHWEVFKWLNERVTSESLSRTRGRRIKGTDEPAGEGLFAGSVGRGGAGGIGPAFEETEGPKPTQSGEIHSPNAQGRGFLANESEQLAQVLLHAEKRDLYLAPLFKDAKSAGMTQKEFNAYAKKLQAMDEADYAKALAAAHKEVERTLTPEWQKEFNEIYNEVETDLRSNPQIAANNFYRTGKLPTGEVRSPLPKLDKATVDYMTNADLSAVTAKGGTHPDDAAMMFSMNSGRELVQALADFDRARGRNTVDKHLKDLITEEANKRMAEKYGDIRDRIAEKAQEIAVENHHIDILIDELKHLARTSGQIPFTIEQIKDRVNDLFNRVPHTEAKFNTYQRAVFKAGRQAEGYLMEGKFDKAFKAKQTQLFAVLAAKKARSFASYKKSNENSFDRIAKNQTLGGVEQPYTDFASDILAGLGYMQPRAHLDHGNFVDFIAEHNGSLVAAYWVVDPTLMRKIDGRPVTYEQLNTEEFTALAKTIQSILHNGREAKKINTLFGKADLDNALFDLVQTMLRWPDKDQPKGMFGIRGGARGVINWVNAAHMLVERMMDYADQFKRGGPFSTYIDRPMRDAYNEEIKLQEAAVKKLKYIRQKYVDTSIYDAIDNREILDPLNGNKPMQLNRWNLRQIWGYLGSKVGRDKLTQGYGITPDQAYSLIIRNATEQDAQYVNSMWELHDDLWKRAALKEERRTGVPVDPREPLPHKLNLASGVTVNMTGGYKRLSYDRDLSSIAQDIGLKGDMFEPGYVTAITTPHSFMIPPTKYTGRLDLTASMESSVMQGMIHDIAFRDTVLDVRKILMSKAATAEGGFREVSKRKWGVYMDRLWDGWLKDIANSHLVEDDFLRGVSHALAIMRQNVVGSLIWLKPTVATKHGLTAAGMSTAQVGPKTMISGIYDVGTAGMRGALRDLIKERGMEPDPAFAASFQKIAKPGKRGAAARAFIYNSSPMMRARRRQYKNSIRGAMESLEQAGWRRGLVDTRQVSLSIGRMAVAMTDAMSADAEWDGAYNKHFRETGDHDEAVNIADRAVTRAHGSSFVGDRSAIMRSKNELIKNTALLFGYWNHYMVNMIQLGWDIGARFSRGAGSEPGATIPSISARIAYLMVVATLADMFAEYMFTHNKHPLWLRTLEAIGRQIGSGYYGIRELTNVALGYEPAAGAFGLALKGLAMVAKDAYRELTTGRSSGNWLRHLTNLIGMSSGIGGDQLGATATGVANLLSGDQQPEDTQEFIRQMATGFSRVPPRR